MCLCISTLFGLIPVGVHSLSVSTLLSLQLVFVSGHFKFSSSGQVLVAMVRPVSPPSILEIRMEGNMFVTHYTLEFKCNFFDGRSVPIPFFYVREWTERECVGGMLYIARCVGHLAGF